MANGRSLHPMINYDHEAEPFQVKNEYDRTMMISTYPQVLLQAETCICKVVMHWRPVRATLKRSPFWDLFDLTGS
jgi:hypothetical protein